jgi:hypothetical protein
MFYRMKREVTLTKILALLKSDTEEFLQGNPPQIGDKGTFIIYCVTSIIVRRYTF